MACRGGHRLSAPERAGRPAPRARHRPGDQRRLAELQGFHNYADHTLTPEFAAGLARLEALARERRTVIVCGEPMPRRCHRLLISNALAARGWHVEHLMTEQAPRPHTLGQWGATPSVGAHGVVTYPLGAPSPIVSSESPSIHQ